MGTRVWSDDRIETLKTLTADGRSPEEIALVLTMFTPGAIKARQQVLAIKNPGKEKKEPKPVVEPSPPYNPAAGFGTDRKLDADSEAIIAAANAHYAPNGDETQKSLCGWTKGGQCRKASKPGSTFCEGHHAEAHTPEPRKPIKNSRQLRTFNPY